MRQARNKALALSIFTVVYNIAEGCIGVAAATDSRSVALMGFGIDSFIESLSGGVMIWRFWGFDADEERFEAVESKAQRLVGYSLLILGAYVLIDAGLALYRQTAPDPSIIGMILAVASLVVMPVLFALKYRLGKSIGSRSLIADSKETLACMLLSAALLTGLGAFYLWRWWWVDSVAALVIAALVIREGAEALRESRN